MNTDDKNTSRPLDPTRSGGDIIGDTTGMTGVTTGSAQQVSATPDDQMKDENKDHLPGGIIEDQQTSPPSPDELTVSDNDPHAIENESPYKAQQDTNKASETDDRADDSYPAHIEPHALRGETVNVQNAAGDDSPNSNRINTETAPYSQQDDLGEQSTSGTTTDPTSDDDLLNNAHATGMQMNEDLEHPEEVDIARDIDKAEQGLHTH